MLLQSLRTPSGQVALLAIGLFLVKAALAPSVELAGYESYYLIFYADHPALSYFDHPGMVGWTLWLSRVLFGDGLLGLRLLFILAGSLAVWFTFLAGRRLWGEKAGRLAAFVIGTAPMFFSIGSRVMPDSPMLLGWAGTLWALSNVFAGRSAAWWYVAGAFTGLCLLSKYPAILLPLGVLMFVAFSPDQRFWLRRKEPYLAVLVGALIFSPTIVWNAWNGWESFCFQTAGRLSVTGTPAWNHPFKYPISHLLLFTPVACLLAWGAGGRVLLRWRTAPWPDRLMASTGMTVLLFFLAVAALRQVKHHWPAPAYASLLILGSARAVEGPAWLRRVHWGTVLVLGAGYLALPAAVPLLPPDYTSTWSRLAHEVRRFRFDFVIADGTWVASTLGYELRPLPVCDFAAVGRPDTRFRRLWRGEPFQGKDALIVYEKRHHPRRMDLVRRCFGRIENPVEVSIPRRGNRKETWLLIRASSYRPPSGS